MKDRVNALSRETVTASFEYCDSGRTQQFALAFLEIFEDPREMQLPGGVGVGPANSPCEFNRNHPASLRLRSRQSLNHFIKESHAFDVSLFADAFIVAMVAPAEFAR